MIRKLLLILLAFGVLGCNSKTAELPVLSYTITETGDKAFYKITYKDFKNQLGQDFTTANLKGKVSIANFFFTRCPSICPPMRNQLIQLAEKFKAESDFLIISHTIDPQNDSITVLKDYADNTGIATTTWQFLRSDVANTKAQAKKFMTNFKPNETGTDFYHSSYVALIDKQQNIRGFYNILVDEEFKRLEKDILVLVK